MLVAMAMAMAGEANCSELIPAKKRPATSSPESSMRRIVGRRPDHENGGDSFSKSGWHRMPQRESSSRTRTRTRTRFRCSLLLFQWRLDAFAEKQENIL